MGEIINLNTALARRSASQMVTGGVTAVEALGGGNNNRLYRVDCSDGKAYALKTYLRQAGDQRDRLGAEFRGIDFVWRNGIRVVPEAVAMDPDRACAMYAWVDGAQVAAPSTTDIDAVLDLIYELRRISRADEALTMYRASASCLSGAEVVTQIDQRLTLLFDVVGDYPDLSRFLEMELVPAYNSLLEEARRGYAQAELDFATPLPRDRQTLSPSDFGFHNALRRDDGSLVFVDFEYFGWDDPAKMVSDFVLHAGMDLNLGLKRRFIKGALEVFGADRYFPMRLRWLYPLFGLCWSLILLNEFKDESWQRRAFANGANNRPEVLNRQLAKARTKLQQVLETKDRFLYDA